MDIRINDGLCSSIVSRLDNKWDEDELQDLLNEGHFGFSAYDSIGLVGYVLVKPVLGSIEVVTLHGPERVAVSLLDSVCAHLSPVRPRATFTISETNEKLYRLLHKLDWEVINYSHSEGTYTFGGYAPVPLEAVY